MGIHYFDSGTTPAAYLGWVADETIDPAVEFPGKTLIRVQAPAFSPPAAPDAVSHLGDGDIQIDTTHTVRTDSQLAALKLLQQPFFELVLALARIVIPVAELPVNLATLSVDEQALLAALKTNGLPLSTVDDGPRMNALLLGYVLAKAKLDAAPAPNLITINGTLLT